MVKIKSNIALYKQVNDKIDGLGYKEETKEHYADWVKMVENEKQKRGYSDKK